MQGFTGEFKQELSSLEVRIANGTWDNGAAKQQDEPGAPQVKDLQISGSGQGTFGPFTTADTFHFYCTVHPGMSLTVVVQ